MKETAKQILKYLGNESTLVEEKEDFKGNYYSYITDTIYLSKDFLKKEQKKSNGISKEAANVIMICHECVHSVQKRYLHILNTIFSNTCILTSFIYIMLRVINEHFFALKVITLIALLASIVVRLILETGAVNGSVNLADRLVNEGKINNMSVVEVSKAKEYINKYKLLALAQMVLDKIIFLAIVIIV